MKDSFGIVIFAWAMFAVISAIYVMAYRIF
jgi:hypothetical protein